MSTAETLLRDADAAQRSGDFAGAATLLERALALAPGHVPARQRYAMLLQQQLDDPNGALAQIDVLIGTDPGNLAYRAFKAAALSQLGDYDGALALQESTLAADDPRGWLRYGHTLKTVGRTADAVNAYRRSLALRPSGEGWWSLADLKSVRFAADEVAAVTALAQRGDLPPAERAMAHFALGKALEDDGAFEASFRSYEAGNALKRTLLPYRAEEMTGFVDRAEAFFTPEFFAARAGRGDPAPDPIFVVGLPRSGSTLVEQILASHPAIEGTMELGDMVFVARKAMGDGAFRFDAYPGALADLDAAALRARGVEYIARTRVYRRQGRPLFIDKMPNNFVHTGLIHLILPNAKIVDVRRHPLACCLSAYTQHFAQGQAFSYSLGDLGRYYADYVRLMAHMDAVLPGRVHRVHYEALVADPEGEVRRLLAYCGVPYDPACLGFHETRRAVRTASSEQVRRPIFRDGLARWRGFEPSLGPLKAALGPALDAYPLAAS